MYDFLVDTHDEQADGALLRFAFGLARQRGAHVTGLRVVAYDASLLVVPDSLIVLDEAEQAAKGRAMWWKALCREHRVTGSWEVHRGFYQIVVARRASLADLVLGSLTGRGAAQGVDLLGRSLLAEAVPVLLVPQAWAGGGGVHRIVIAWNGSDEAARAVRAASPLFGRGVKVTVLDGEPCARDVEQAQGQPVRLPLKAWLKRHGIAARWERFDPTADTGQCLHERAVGLDAQVLVMGAWGHTRMGEWLLGGVTRHMLRHTRLPLLLAH